MVRSVQHDPYTSCKLEAGSRSLIRHRFILFISCLLPGTSHSSRNTDFFEREMTFKTKVKQACFLRRLNDICEHRSSGPRGGRLKGPAELSWPEEIWFADNWRSDALVSSCRWEGLEQPDQMELARLLMDALNEREGRCRSSSSMTSSGPGNGTASILSSPSSSLIQNQAWIWARDLSKHLSNG
ncbi:uncharacterized protein LOC128627155 isoform X2 [Artibeus jamaicensis]|uniref:uncharacterized protein LOC128627155 isoform X2 n=1 Tax=Artibeus jamaicensis TaxID=9417 RepID=UPI00235B2EEE|nr:uncharacterized protein LOC128627155 isoform X2 [Artibeus jamaicensis]